MAGTLIVLGSGGHTGEMLHMVKKLDKEKHPDRVYVCAASDDASFEKATRFEADVMKSTSATIYCVPRARSVGQSYLTSVFTTLYAFLASFLLILRLRPSLLITNGPGTALPLVYSLFIIRLFGLRSRTIFFESFCRVTSLSLAAKLCRPVVDRFVVHWPGLAKKGEYVPGLLF